MAKEIKFNVKLLVDGKEQLVTATSTVAELRNALDAAKTEAQKLDEALVNFNQRVEKLQNINNAVSQIAGVLNAVTEESRSFSAAMNAANTMAGKSGAEFASLKGEVAELAKVLPIARDELAQGLYQTISNGVPENNWIDFLTKSAKASAGGLADLEETVKVTSTVIKNYGLSWDAAGDIQDKIQLTAKNGVTSFEQLAQALPRVTSNAATLGVSVDELMATFATLTGVSGNTAEVSTQLAAVFTALVKPSSEATKTAEQMGIQFDAAAIKAAGGMHKFLTELASDVRAYADKSGMLEQEVYAKLFGSAESLRALTPLTGQLASKFDENVEAMKGSAGTIEEAFTIMGDSGAARLQMLRNKVGEFTDGITSSIQGLLPAINITSQVGNSIVAVLALNMTLRNFAITQGVVKARILATNAASLVWNATSVRMNALVRLMSASFRGAAVSATTLKLAIQGLLISTGVGIALVALTEIISAFISTASKAQLQAKDTAKGIEGIGEAADELKTAYDNALKNTYSDIMAKYEGLRSEWKKLATEQQKVAWIKENQKAFEDLRLRINGVTDAENIFRRKTDAVVEAFKQRALAAAYAAKLTALYGRQIELLDKKKSVEEEYKDSAKRNGRHAKEGDIIPGAFRDSRYGKVDQDGIWRFTKEGAGRYNGTNVSGNSRILDIDKSLKAVNQQIEETQKELKDRLRTADKFIEPGTLEESPAVNATPSVKAADGNAQDKTFVEKLREKLSVAKKEMENALTVEAKVGAEAKVRDIQAQIDRATKGKVTIEAEIEPDYVVQGSSGDKRKSYENAQSRASRIQTDYEIGLVGKDEAMKEIAEINGQLAELGLKPIRITLDTGALNKVFADIKNGWGDIQGVGNGIQGISDALDGNANAWQRISDIINGFLSLADGISGIVQSIQKITAATVKHTAATATDTAATITNTEAKSGEAIAGATASGASMPFPLNLVAIASGVAAVIAALAAISGFATGGVVGGTSTSGDKKFVRVNSGEMILNKFQQAKLFGMIDGKFSPPAFKETSRQSVAFYNLAGVIDPASTEVNINLNADARRLFRMMDEVKRVTGKSGRKYSI